MAFVAIAKAVLVLLNLVIGLIALLMIAVGAVMEYGRELFDSYVKPMLDDLMANSGNAGMSITITEDDWEMIFSSIHMVAIPLMVAGIVLFAVTFCACCGVCCSSKVLLLVYSAIISILTIVFIVGGVWVYLKKEELLVEFQPTLQQWVADQYQNETATDIASLAINLLNIFGECCGIVDYRDFDDYPKTVTVTINGYSVPGVQVVPATCCKGVTMDNPIPSDLNCTTAPTDLNTNMNKGCYQDFILAYLDEYSDYVMYAGIGLLVFMAMITVFAWISFCSLKTEPKRRVTYA